MRKLTSGRMIDNSNNVVDVADAAVGYDVFLEPRFPTVPNLPLS